MIEGLRQEAQAKPGFDIKAFPGRMLLNGSVPLAVLQDIMRA